MSEANSLEEGDPKTLAGVLTGISREYTERSKQPGQYQKIFSVRAAASGFLVKAYAEATGNSHLAPAERWKDGAKALESILKRLGKVAEKGGKITKALSGSELAILRSELADNGVPGIKRYEDAMTTRTFLKQTVAVAAAAATGTAFAWSAADKRFSESERNMLPVSTEDMAPLEKIMKEKIKLLEEWRSKKEGVDFDKWTDLSDQEQQLVIKIKMTRTPSSKGMTTVAVGGAATTFAATLIALLNYKPSDSKAIEEFKPRLQAAVEAVAEIIGRQDVQAELAQRKVARR